MKDESLDCIAAVPEIKVGHAQSPQGNTGCTVILCEKGAIAGVDIGGSAPGTRETEMLNPTNSVMAIHAVLLTGGSTFGLAAASGVQSFLQQHDIGFHASTGVVVPIVPTACIFDLDISKPKIYPDHTMGLSAAQAAKDTSSPSGAIGVGIGATCGKAHSDVTVVGSMAATLVSRAIVRGVRAATKSNVGSENNAS